MSENTQHQAAAYPSFVAAFFAMQQELPEIKKESVADAGEKRGLMYYANLKTVTDAVYPVLAKFGFIWSCQPTTKDDKPQMRYELTHISHTEDNPQQRIGFYPIFGDNKPQAFGAAITYARRYALCAVVGLTPDKEDEGEGKPVGAAVRRKPSAKAATQPVDPDAVPGPPLPGEPADRMTQVQQKSIFALLRELKVADADRFTTVNPILTEAGHEAVTSFSQLTIEGGRAIYRGLKKELDARTSGAEEPA